MLKNQKGFSIFEVLVVLLIIALVGGAGWYVRSKKKVDDTQPSSQNSKAASGENDFTNTKEYTFTLPDGWKEQLYSRYNGDPSKGQYGELLPSSPNNAGQIIFQSGLKNPAISLDIIKSSPYYMEAVKGKNIEGALVFDTKIDPNINNLEVIFISERYQYRFAYEAKKEFTDYKKLPYYEDFLQIVQSFRISE